VNLLQLVLLLFITLALDTWHDVNLLKGLLARNY